MRANSIGALMAMAITGCETAAVQVSQEQVTYEQQIKPLLDAKCGSCHVEGGIAPFALSSLDDARSHAADVKAAVQMRTMPPWLAAPGNEPLRFDRSLSQEQVDLISRWVDDGAAPGDADSPGAPLDVDMGGISRVDVTLEMPIAYAPDAQQEDVYRCFVLDWPEPTTRYVTGFNAVAGNTRIVHHLVTFLVSPNQAALLEQFDAEDPGPGYTCFGGPSAQGAAALSTTFFGQWAPGMRGIDLPANSGILVAPGSKVVLQVHYHPDGDESDKTMLQYRVDDTVAKRGYYLPWFDLKWYQDPRSMRIPAGESDIVHSYASTAARHSLLQLFAPDANFREGMLLHSVMLHMHKLGTQIALFSEDSEQNRSTLVAIPRWDFDWQNEYLLERPRLIAADEAIGIECHWNNTRDSDAQWGEGTRDEMCISFLYVTEP